MYHSVSWGRGNDVFCSVSVGDRRSAKLSLVSLIAHGKTDGRGESRAHDPRAIKSI